MKTRIITTGAQGLVGSKFVQSFSDHYDFISLDIHDPVSPVDITNSDQVIAAFHQAQAAVVVHFAAFTDVTTAWSQRGDRESLAYQVNVVGTENIVTAATATQTHLIHVSTSYVFDGTKPEPYIETDTPHPIEWYGETKLLAEQAVQSSRGAWTILRIDQPFRSDAFPKPDIIRKMLSSMSKPQPASFFTDHFVGPTFIDDFAKVIDWVIRTRTLGLFHASSGESWTDYDLAMALCELHHLPKNFTAGSLQDYAKTLNRPYQQNTALSTAKLKGQLDFEMKTVGEAIKLLDL